MRDLVYDVIKDRAIESSPRILQRNLNLYSTSNSLVPRRWLSRPETPWPSRRGQSP